MRHAVDFSCTVSTQEMCPDSVCKIAPLSDRNMVQVSFADDDKLFYYYKIISQNCEMD